MNKTTRYKGFGSAAVHAGHTPDPNYAHQTPIYATSTFVYDTAEQGMRRFSGQEEGYIYSRWGNPTVSEAEGKIAALETFGLDFEVHAILHASGMAAISTLVQSNLKTGDAVLSHFSLYGGTDDYFHRILPQFGMRPIIRDLRELAGVEDLLKSDPSIRMLYLETPANPTIQLVDIRALTEIAKRHSVLVAVDNTFATPYLQQPFALGVDFVMHSTTKFLNGHGTAIGGVLLGRDVEHMKTAVTKTHRLLGGNANPFDAFLLSQGIKTLELRMDRHGANAQQVAQFLEGHAAIAGVNFAGLSSHPQHELMKRQMKGPGAMLSFELKGGFDAGVAFMNRLQFCTRTVSLGTTDTLLSHPASMTHFSVPREQRLRYGISDGLIRMSVGIENAEDLLADLDQALKS